MKIKSNVNIGTILAKIVTIFAFMLICIPINGWFTMLAWNYLALTFGLPVLTWFQAMALQFLCVLLFEGGVSIKSSK